MRPNNLRRAPLKSRPESGNVFFIIMIAVMLFAALAFTFTKGLRQGVESIGHRQAELAASDIMNYAQQLERGVQKLLLARISENNLSFENSIVSGYTNADCADNFCKIFSNQGGGITWQNPPAKANAGQHYIFTTNRVGSADGTTKQLGTTARDLVVLLPVKKPICDAINRNTNGFDTWDNTGTINTAILFTGSFTTGGATTIARDNEVDQPSSGCFMFGPAPGTADDVYYFYSVLLER